MKLNVVILTMILTLAAINAQSQTTDNPPQFGAQSPREEIRQRDQRPEESESLTGDLGGNAMTSFSLRSSEVQDGGTLPVEFTGDGASATLPLEWTGAPAETKSYALIMHHIAPDMAKWYWIIYNIPANVTSLPKNVKGIGTWGNNSVNDRTEYAPPHSKGPGAKTYILTIYALSAPPQLTVPPSQVNREVLLAAMKDKILGTSELSVVYTRTGDGTTR